LRLFSELWRRAIAPEKGFRDCHAEAPTLGASLRRLLLLRTPLAFASSALGYWGFRRAYEAFRSLEGTTGDLTSRFLREAMSVDELRSVLAELPRFPELKQVLPWLLLGAPLTVLGLWLHDAVWDHGCLWLLGGLKTRRGFRATMIAESEALAVGTLGAALGLLDSLPYLGGFLALPLLAVGIWFWILRGYALAAWHDCAIWKGVGATVIHGLLAACCLLGLFGLCFAILAVALS